MRRVSHLHYSWRWIESDCVAWRACRRGSSIGWIDDAVVAFSADRVDAFFGMSVWRDLILGFVSSQLALAATTVVSYDMSPPFDVAVPRGRLDPGRLR